MSAFLSSQMVGSKQQVVSGSWGPWTTHSVPDIFGIFWCSSCLQTSEVTQNKRTAGQAVVQREEGPLSIRLGIPPSSGQPGFVWHSLAFTSSASDLTSEAKVSAKHIMHFIPNLPPISHLSLYLLSLLWLSLLQSVPGMTGTPNPLHLVPEISTCDTTQRSSCTSPGTHLVVALPTC